MKAHLKAGYFLLQKLLRRDRALLERIRREDLTVVLNLHQVSPVRNPFWAPLAPELFDDLLGYLKEHFEVVLFRELDEAAGSRRPRAVLSFDDGYYNYLEYAAPILRRHGLRANQNVIPECVETGRPVWNVRLYDFLNAAPRSLVDEIRLPGFDARLTSDGDDAKVRYGLAISRYLKMRPRREREELWPRLEVLIARLEHAPTRMMNAAEIRALAAKHEIGAHSYSHESMEFEPVSFFEEDLEKCHNYFARELGLPLDVYAFPNGSYRAEQIEILRRRGVAHVLLVGEDYAARGARVYPRFTIYGASRYETRLQSLGFNKKL